MVWNLLNNQQKYIAMKKSYLSLSIISVMIFIFSACYDDIGNYDYKEINELSVQGIENSYERDVDDSLNIIPILTGTQYSDTSLYTYKWEINSSILAESQELHLKINLTTGEKKCRYIVTDKKTGIQYYTPFQLSVKSSTAADLIVVLSKYQGRAELSYLRLDKPSVWAVNYYFERFGKELGFHPQQLHLCYVETKQGSPVTCPLGRLMVLCDDRIALFDKSTMAQDSLTPYLTGEAYEGIAVWPPKDEEETSSYKSQFVASTVTMWRTNPYGSGFQQGEEFYEISGGRLYTVSTMTNSSSRSTFKSGIKSHYDKGYLCPFGFWDNQEDKPLGNLGEMGRQPGDFIMFDKVNGRFTFYDGGWMRSVNAGMPTYSGYELIWGNATNLTPNNRCLAILSDGSQTRLAMLETGQDPESIGGRVRTKFLVKEISGGIISPSSKFYIPHYVDHLYFTVGNTFYCYTISDMLGGVIPDNNCRIFDLTQYGYDANAIITDICVSRSEKTLLVGVSRYGTDTEAMTEAPMGDILYFDLDVSNKQFKYNAAKSARGIAGIPIDIEIKYQTYWRNGCEQDGITLKDNI